MGIRSTAFVMLAASIAIGTAGCGTNSSPTVVTAASAPSASSPNVVQAGATDRAQPAADPKPAATPAAPAPEPAVHPKPVATQEPSAAPEPAAGPQTVTTSAPAESGPYGSGHGLCFDVNSALAASAVAQLAPPPAGSGWVVQGGSGDPIQAGCSGVLSWMQVEWQGIHPGSHILFFTNGTYLGTATSKPYGYTEILGKTKDTVSVQYRWAKPDDALCCPQGGPSVVTFSLNGTTVQANGQFPPDN
ncbi:LppP/LprE family lipoprotein [Nocardia sp. NPDC004604]|uniref:LppP/LprE family lipoprotein n=1 Tax=Nocardia sp. NPDC004604 TaxID=3157013 RepID=UPI0033AE036E